MGQIKRVLQHALSLRKRKKLPKFKRMRPPYEIERNYVRRIKPVLEKVHKMVKVDILPRLPALAAQYYKNRPATDHRKRMDESGDDVVDLLKGLSIKLQDSYSDDELAGIARQIGLEVSDYNLALLRDGIKRVANIDLFFPDGYLAEELSLFAANNVQLIRNLGQDALDRIQGEIFAGFRNGERWEDIADRILAVSDPEDSIEERRALFIARDQVSKLNGSLNHLRQMDLGLERYTWRTCLDERVRPDHAAKEGEVFSFDDPPADTGAPSEDYGCRCWAEPLLEELLDEQPDEEDQADE